MTLSWNRDYSLNKDKFSVGTLNGRIKVNHAKTGMESYFDKFVFCFVLTYETIFYLTFILKKYIVNLYKKLQGWVKFPIGGIPRER